MNHIAALLDHAKAIHKRQEEMIKLRGEHFNIFSVLKMETRENATHSAFLGELLNPKGSHLMGAVFLKHFLATVGYDSIREFHLDPTSLELEKPIGKRDDENKTGGRVDIYIKDRKDNTITIENKIYAADQNAQIERYVNYNYKEGENTVYYLTLNGQEASEESRGELKDGEDYHCISYRSHIIEWLDLCLTEAADQPILKSSIKQYILLVKKLTNQLGDTKMDKEVYQLIKKNYQAAKEIESYVWRAEREETKIFLVDIAERVKDKLGENWSIEIGDVSNSWTGLGIKHKSWEYAFVQFQGAPYMATTDSGYGIRASKSEWDRDLMVQKLLGIEELNESFGDTEAWPYFTKNMSMRTSEERARIFKSDERKVLIDVISLQLIELAQFCESVLAGLKPLNKPFS